MIEVPTLRRSPRGLDVARLKVDELAVTGETAKRLLTPRPRMETEPGKEDSAADQGFLAEDARRHPGQTAARQRQ